MISLAELQRRIDAGELSPEAAITQSLEEIDAWEKSVGAFACRAQNVRAASTGPLRGKLRLPSTERLETIAFSARTAALLYRHHM